MSERIRQFISKHDIKKIKVGVFDIDGLLRGKYISMDKFLSAVDNGMGFCDVIFGWDSADELYVDTGVTVTGWHTGYPDTPAKIDPDSARVVPWEPGTALFLADLYTGDGIPLGVSPRQLMRRVVTQANEMGFDPKMSSEYEYFFFKEDPHSIREKSYTDLTPLTPGMFGYSVVRASSVSDLVHAVIDNMKAFGILIEGIHTETGPGVYETAITYDTAINAADNAALFKTAMKEISSRHDVIVTFMAKWNPEFPGCSGHIHQSLWSADGKKNLFYDDRHATSMSTTMRHYIGGQIALMPELTALSAPTINSYKRLVPGAWAPTTASWGIENRTTAIRAIPFGENSTRVENRLPGSDANPYLAMAASLAAGLYGIAQEIEPPEPWSANAYTAPDGIFEALPRSLDEAISLLKESQVAKDILGTGFVDHYVATREWEVRQHAKAVTDWELKRYFEVV